MTKLSARLKTRTQWLLCLFAQSDLFFFSLIWLMVILVTGTIAQRYLGLYVSQMRFFSSFYFWVGFVPLPGGYPVLFLIFFGLLARLLVATQWAYPKLGINVLHMGALLLLLGAFATSVFSEEGAMILAEGERADFFADYRSPELVFVDTRPKEHDLTTAFSGTKLQPGTRLGNLPFQVEILRFFQNCRINQISAPITEQYRGFGRQFSLTDIPEELEAENNLMGIIFRVAGAGKESDGVYVLREQMPVPQTLEFGGGKFILRLRRIQKKLPFSLELKKFKKRMYPGTDIAQAYSSDLILREGNVEHLVRVQMNEPLRFRGYTFYQASFFDDESRPSSVLAVVKNVGRIFPYVSGLIMAFGLLFHLLVQIPRLFQSAPKRHTP